MVGPRPLAATPPNSFWSAKSMAREQTKPTPAKAAMAASQAGGAWAKTTANAARVAARTTAKPSAPPRQGVEQGARASRGARPYLPARSAARAAICASE